MSHLLYLDPGSSSLIIQMIVAGALGVVFFFKNGWYRIKSFFTRKHPESDKDKKP